MDTFMEVWRSGRSLPAQELIPLMREFTLSCVATAAKAHGLSDDELAQLLREGPITPDRVGRYRQTRFTPVAGLTPFFKQFQPDSVVFDRIMIGTSRHGWLSIVRINTVQTDAGYRINAIYAGLMRWGKRTIGIESEIVQAATSAWEAIGTTLDPIDRDESGEHLWGVRWEAEDWDGSAEELAREIGHRLAALLPVLQAHYTGDEPGPEIPAIFRIYDEARNLEFNRRSSELMPDLQERFEVEVGDATVIMRTTWFDRQNRLKSINTCEGDFANLRELQEALDLKGGDRLRFIPLGPGRYRLVKEADTVSIHDVGIFVRLGRKPTVSGQEVNGFETMEIYQRVQVELGVTWFSTNSLSTGMIRERITRFKAALERGETVKVYFMVGINGGGSNQIEYTATLLDLASDRTPIPCPEEQHPPEFENSAKIWLKLADLRREQLSAHDFVTDEGRNDLAQAVAQSQFQFGYIRTAAGPGPGPTPKRRYTEPEVLDFLMRYLEESGFLFRREVVLNYWISLKTKPFVILAGLSGSGKSKLPWLVAKALGARFAQVAVSPGWTEDSDLLGYRNPLDTSGRFQTTDFSNFLLEAAADQDDRLWIVTLDEMNLARVEHYFAKFLSAMEGLEPGHRTVHLHNGADPAVPQSVSVPLNFFFTGTVNMDETTHTFSPKVLDRANLIEFDVEPDDLREDVPASRTPERALGLTWSNFQAFCAPRGDSRFRDDLIQIAKLLYPIKAHFGFRVREEIERFIANGRDLLDPQLLFDLQIHQKVLPKLRGSGSGLETALRQLKDLCQSRDWPRSSAKVEEMLDRLLADGITGFYR